MLNTSREGENPFSSKLPYTTLRFIQYFLFKNIFILIINAFNIQHKYK